MRVARIITRLNVGGPAKQVEVLNELPVETHVITGVCEKGEREYELRPGSYVLHKIPELQRGVNLWRDFRAYLRVKKILQEIRPSLVHTHTSKAGAIGRVAAWRVGVPCCHTYHGHVFHSYFGSFTTTIVKVVERSLARISARIITISPSQRGDIRQVIRPVDGKRTRVVYNGFDLSPFLTDMTKEEARRRLRWHPKEWISLFVGRDVGVKRKDRFVEYANKRGVKYIVVNGWVRPEDMPMVYKAVDELVMCSDNEGTPTTVIEAIAAGCLVNFLTCPGGCRDLTMMSREEVLATFDKERLKKDIMDLYKEVLDE